MSRTEQLQGSNMQSSPKLKGPEPAELENSSPADEFACEAILRKRICLEDAALLSRNKNPLKRLFDISISLIVLVIASPLMLLIAVMIKLTSPGPIFFKQQRVGFMGKVFMMYKFRTMEVKTDSGIHQEYVTDLFSSDRPMIKIDNCHRLIPFGKIIRRLFIDELPQLFNVVRGQMSLVGPRPAIPYEVQAYKDRHMGRLLAMPGMTGLWQVSGKNRLTFDEMVRMDIRYAHTCSFLRDMKILMMTPFAIIAEVRNKQNH
jgi:lipopolysaccharide/colanic/teichoic acid biosynthesis glycosyltransferase